MFFRFGIFEGYRERRGDSIPETAFALIQKLLYWNASPQKPMQPTNYLKKEDYKKYTLESMRTDGEVKGQKSKVKKHSLRSPIALREHFSFVRWLPPDA